MVDVVLPVLVQHAADDVGSLHERHSLAWMQLDQQQSRNVGVLALVLKTSAINEDAAGATVFALF